MKNKLFAFLALACFSTLYLQLTTVFAQGSLTPPGAPAPTMKTLNQIEPRIVVNAMNTPGDGNDLFIINQPGSYYLTTNLVGVSGKNGITITTNNVTLDLNGFTLQGGSGSVDGIYISGAQANITVRNGTISGWGNNGVQSASAYSFNMVCERLSVSASFSGIYVNGAWVVRDCNCLNNVVGGISAQNATISGCSAQNNGANGISAFAGIVSGCSAENNGADGIYVAPGIVSGCFVLGNTNSGIFVDSPGSEVTGNTCIGNNAVNSSLAAGIYLNDKNNRVEDNHVTASGYAGIQVNAAYTNNFIIKNSVSGNGGNNYIMPGSQIVGPLITTAGTITNSNPWANFSF